MLRWGCGLFLSTTVYSYDIDQFLYVVFIAPIICFCFIVAAVVIALRKRPIRSLSIVSMLVVYCAVTWALLRNPDEIHSKIRWLYGSKTYKSQVLSQSNSTNGGLKHIEWDSWGWGGDDTFVYLVYDPSDSLLAAAQSHASGKFAGIPCRVPVVYRMDRHWYSVVFYTNTGWDSCH